MVTAGSARFVERMVGNFADAGIETAALYNFGELDNARQAGVDPAPVTEFARNAVLQAGAEAILIWSTNLPGHGMAAGIEQQTGIPVFDSAAIGIWAGLSILRHDMSAAAPRGRLFAGR
jgi:maleate isomerase